MKRLRNLPRPDPAALGAAGVFLVCWALVHRGWWAQGQLTDIPVYQNYGDAIVHHGQVPYRDFPVEYPPASLVPFVVPSLTGGYTQVFSLLMAACGVGVVFVVGSLRRAALPFLAVSPLLIGPMVFSRFDLWPSLFVVGALVALVRGRDRLGWALLGIAVAAKIWPLALVPLALAWTWRRGRVNAELAGIATAAACFVPFAIVAPHGVWHSLRGQGSRPLQIESLGAAFLTTFSHPAEIWNHGSQNILGHSWIGTLLVAITAVSLIALWIAFARGSIDEARFLRYCAAATCAVIAFGKVLSPQYLIWLVPLVPLVRGRRGYAATGVLTAALLLTQAYFPAHYWPYVLQFKRAGVVLARDLSLVVLFAVLSLPGRRRAARHTP